MTHTSMKATFGAGCFWHVEALFDKINGVTSTKTGYTGGNTPDPTYEQVCTDKTGHAEAVQVEYNPDEVSYQELLDVFWNNHNPTTLNRQGPDVGIQYRSVIFVHNEEQKVVAQTSKQQVEQSGKFDKPIVTEILAAVPFYDAEQYHQKYFKKQGII